ncbi:chemotaxis protein CheW [Massilia sp.]|uniref:chemotaxis protein CheW n=1 Tax=Massilia sp. TaxID=1882437 RepID=UPI00289D5064|nr:chemotaxis protein CheW [Massilia sp.]
MSGDKLLQLAQACIGAVWVGVPADSVVQAIPFPSAPALLPRRQGALAGVVEHAGRLVPVIDLARWVYVGTPPQEAGRPATAHVLILHAAGRTIGLKVDRVGALAEVAADDVTCLHHDDHEEEVFQCAVRLSGNDSDSDSDRILSLLDVDRLAHLSAAWHQDVAPAAPSAMPEKPPSALRSYAVLQAGAARVALAADVLSEVLPLPPLDVLGAGSAYCIWRGRHLPVLTHAALGLEPAVDGTAPKLLAVVERAGLALGLPVHAALSLQSFDTTGLAQPDGLLSALFDPDGTPLRLLDEACLFARFPEAELSRDGGAEQRNRSDAARASRQVANSAAYIVFEGDGMYAAPIETVERIVSLREVATDGDGAMAWEGRPIRLRDLRAGAGDAAGGDVMVVRSGDAHVGYVVSRVHLLVPPGSGRIYRMGGAGAGWEFIATGDNAAQASYRIVDLGALAA